VSDHTTDVNTRYVTGGLVMSGTLMASATEVQCRQALRIAYAGALHTEGGLAVVGGNLQLVWWLPGLMGGTTLAKKTEKFSRYLQIWHDALERSFTKIALSGQAQRTTMEQHEARIRQKIMRT
jgi:hypothetical protein